MAPTKTARRLYTGFVYSEPKKLSHKPAHYAKSKQHKAHKRVSAYKEMRNFYHHVKDGAMDVGPKVFYRTLMDEIDKSKTYRRLVKIAKTIFSYESGIGNHVSEISPRSCNALDNTLKRKATKLHCFDPINLLSIQHQLRNGAIPFGGVADNHNLVAMLEEMQENCEGEESTKFLNLLKTSRDYRKSVEDCYAHYKKTGQIHLISNN